MEGGIVRFCRPNTAHGEALWHSFRALYHSWQFFKRWKHGTKLHFDKTCQQQKNCGNPHLFSDSGSGKNITRIRLKGTSSSYVSDSSCQHGNVKRNPLTNRQTPDRIISILLDVDLLVVMSWLELWTTYRSSSQLVTTTTTSIILCFNKHRLTQIHLENGC